MPDTHDNHVTEAEAATSAPAENRAPERPAPSSKHETPQEAVVDAEVVDEVDVQADGPEEAAEAQEASTDTAPESDEGKRPAFHGHKATPHARKPAKQKKPRKAHPKRARRIALACILAVLAAILVGTSLFCWQKWMRFDDTADIQGVWKVQATGDTIVFDGRKLKLTKGISYEYELNVDEKLITYSFGDLEGDGHYYFSDDRQTLIIIDGDERLDTLAEVGFLPQDLVQNDDASDNKTVLSKVSGDTSAEPSGMATGVATGHSSSEREYVVKPEPSSSSSSSSKKKSSDSESDEDEDAQRGFVDEDGDGFDDETGLEYEEFQQYLADMEENADSEDEESSDEYDEASDEADEDAPADEGEDSESDEWTDEDVWYDEAEDGTYE